MAVEEILVERIKEVIASGQELRRGNEYDQVFSQDHVQKCVAWFAPAQNIIELVCPNPESSYRKRAEAIANSRRGLMTHTAVGEFTDLLSHLLIDIDRGLLSSLVNRVRAETYDDFLDHSEAYYRDGKKNEAAVIAGVVFEDTIRKICDKYMIAQKGEKLDNLISELAKADIISQTKAKRARAGAHVRTKATHAQWDEFDLNDVKVTIDFSRELIADKLGH